MNEQSAASYIEAELKKPVQKLNKDELKDALQVQLARMESIVNMFGIMNQNEIDNFTQKIQDGFKSKFFLGLYTKIVIQFTRQEDRKYAFAGFINTAKNFSLIFNSILRSINEIVNTREITIFNAKLSHAAIFGLLNRGNLFADFTRDLFNGVLYDVISNNGVSEVNPPDKKTIAKLNDNATEIVSIVNTLSTMGPSSLANLVKYIAFNDDVLVDEDKKPKQLQLGDRTSYQKNFIQYGLGSISWIMVAYGSVKNSLKAYFNKQAQTEKEWMKHRVAILQMSLAGVDPDSKQYRDTVKMIDKYDKLIQETQARIDEYEGVNK